MINKSDVIAMSAGFISLLSAILIGGIWLGTITKEVDSLIYDLHYELDQMDKMKLEIQLGKARILRLETKMLYIENKTRK